LFYRFRGRLRRFTIGNYPAIRPADARREAQIALDRVRAGGDPAEEKRARREARAPEADTFGAVLDDYLNRHLRANRRESTYLEAKRCLEHDALPRWRKRPIATITRGDVIDLVDNIVARGARVQANRVLAWLRALFNWAIEKERLAASPVARMKRPAEEQARDRVLADDEIRWLWTACHEIGWPAWRPGGPPVQVIEPNPHPPCAEALIRTNAKPRVRTGALRNIGVVREDSRLKSSKQDAQRRVSMPLLWSRASSGQA
jgi:hypothetical protein